jgi:hypothetical protein
MKRRNAPVGTGAIVPALPATSVLLAKLPAIREFLTATEYEDKSPRQPGYVTFRNRVVAFELTLYDPDGGARLAVRGPTIDQCLQLAEQMLGVEEAPWELDSYLQEQLARRAKKKKRTG